MLNLSNIKKAGTKKKKRVGRGDSSGSGTYSGRGQKGQRSRSGGRGGLKLKGLKETVSKLPKTRGFKSGRPSPGVVNIADLERKHEDGDRVRLPGIKVLGQGKLTKKLDVAAAAFSKSAEGAIIKAGGKITRI